MPAGSGLSVALDRPGLPTAQLVSGAALLLLAVLTLPAGAAPISDAQKFAWSETGGWLNFNAGNFPVQVFPDHLEGYIWAENAGWIRLGTFSGGGSHTYENLSATNYGVNIDSSGSLSGYGWGENIGWVSFNQASIDPQTGIFAGYAWSENLGWISLGNTSAGYGVAAVGDQFPGTTAQPIPVFGPLGLLLQALGLVLLAGLFQRRPHQRHQHGFERQIDV